jgi:transmembrane sensor
MSHTLFLNLLAKKLAGEATADEVQQLGDLLLLNPDWAYQAEHLEQLWQSEKEEHNSGSELAFEQHMARMKEAGVDFPRPSLPAIISKAGDKKRKIVAWSVAAVFLLLAAGLLWYNNKTETVPSTEKNYSEVSSPIGSKTKLLLPDGTVVWLNAGSKLTYNERFGITNRNTTLEGEAFFDVKKTSVPFIIRANSIQIKVLGTAFNVKAYPDEKITETSLVRGRVEVLIDKRPGEPIILRPNEKLVVANEKSDSKTTDGQKREPKVAISELTHINDTTIIETSWVRNELIFQDETFGEVALKMQRWYGVMIELKDDGIATERLSGTFTTESVQEALTALQLTTKFHYSIKGNLIMITQ